MKPDLVAMQAAKADFAEYSAAALELLTEEPTAQTPHLVSSYNQLAAEALERFQGAFNGS